MHLFFELYSDLPRQGPGDDASTLKTLSLVPYLPRSPRILDIGCGSGMQTLALARRTGGCITAVDIHQPYLDRLEQKAREAGLSEQISTLNCSMESLSFEDESFDLIWSEGAIYLMGFRDGLKSINRFLKPGGTAAVTDVAYLVPHPPPQVAAFWDEEYPAIDYYKNNLSAIKAAGYRFIDSFVLPESAWWENYYHPLAARCRAFRRKYENNPEAAAIAEMTEKEIALFREHAASYGYVFYIMQKPG